MSICRSSVSLSVSPSVFLFYGTFKSALQCHKKRARVLCQMRWRAASELRVPNSNVQIATGLITVTLPSCRPGPDAFGMARFGSLCQVASVITRVRRRLHPTPLTPHPQCRVRSAECSLNLPWYVLFRDKCQEVFHARETSKIKRVSSSQKANGTLLCMSNALTLHSISFLLSFAQFPLIANCSWQSMATMQLAFHQLRSI